MMGHVEHIAGLVGKLDQLGSLRQAGCVLDLQLLAYLFLEALVVRDLLDQGPDLGAEPLLQFCGRVGTRSSRREPYLAFSIRATSSNRR